MGELAGPTSETPPVALTRKLLPHVQRKTNTLSLFDQHAAATWEGLWPGHPGRTLQAVPTQPWAPQKPHCHAGTTGGSTERVRSL